MFVEEENPGGSLLKNDYPLSSYIRIYKQLGDHVKRYKFAKQFARGKNIIEFGCGGGSGSVIMDGIFESYLGIDIDKNAINYAKKEIQKSTNKITFELLSDFQKRTVPYQADLVICYEVIEHVKDPKGLLSYLVSLVKKDGIILLSTPNGLSSISNKALFRSRFHVMEYTPLQFFDLLKEYGTPKIFGERRIDSLDVMVLRKRLELFNKNKNEKLNEVASASVAIGSHELFFLAKRYFNRSALWQIYRTDIYKEEKKLHCSTLICILKPDSFNVKTIDQD